MMFWYVSEEGPQLTTVPFATTPLLRTVNTGAPLSLSTQDRGW